ncbi:MAG: methyltransferase [Opitutaceae bacterium]|jgi:2-polyprenyl-3-methyl-5-hydroxy-6-metoxy-1,4-benzoquinol methylase|nr:methyltransferase [Opitutaceae bacterium]
MTTLTLPPPSLLPPPLSSGFAEPTPCSLPFYGRSLAEYTASFDLDLTALRHQAVLDVGAGPSSFAVEANRRGVDVVAVDPLYGCPMTTLATYVQLDYARVAVEGTRRLSGAPLARREALEQDRRTAAQRFLADYESGFLHNRYLGAALPHLPFLDGAFDVVLCGHVLFSPPAPLDPERLVAACVELVRVSTGSVRVAPLTGLTPALADHLTRALAARGIVLECRPGQGGRTARCSLGLLRRLR